MYLQHVGLFGFWALSSYKPLVPREGEPRQPNKAYEGLLGTIGPHGGQGSPPEGTWKLMGLRSAENVPLKGVRAALEEFCVPVGLI